MKRKPVVMWAVKYLDADPILTARTRKRAIELVCNQPWDVWKDLYSWGYRCVKVEIREVKP